MAFADLDGLRVYYRLEGRADRPVLVLAHSLGLDHGMWDDQVPDLLAHFRVLRYDVRGHGGTDGVAGEYTVEQLGRDALLLLDRLGLPSVAWCGVSLGGMVGQWLAVHAADRLFALVLANTSPRIADPAGMEARRRTVLAEGMAAIVETVMARFFLRPLLDANPPRVASTREALRATSPVGYAGCCAALRDFDGTADLGRIRTRTLVVSGDADVAMPWDEHGQVLARGIPGATPVRLGTAHLSNLGLPRTFTRTMLEFLLATPADSFEAGLDVRRAVLGADYVAHKLDTSTPFTRAYQNLITRYAWGAVWSRPGLDHRTRRLLVLAATSALGRWDEFELHLGAALDAGLEPIDVEEVLLQTAVYAGVPAANTGFRIAAEELARRQRHMAAPPEKL
jgi:3-oxoadipate enol-lactonase/4-carboxymuconolactone decarboxylase